MAIFTKTFTDNVTRVATAGASINVSLTTLAQYATKKAYCDKVDGLAYVQASFDGIPASYRAPLASFYNHAGIKIEKVQGFVNLFKVVEVKDQKAQAKAFAYVDANLVLATVETAKAEKKAHVIKGTLAERVKKSLQSAFSKAQKDDDYELQNAIMALMAK